MGQASPFLEAADLLEQAALRRFGTVRAFQRATGVRHSLFAAMRRGNVPGLKTLTSACHGLGVTFASVLAACWQLDFNTLPRLHQVSASSGTILLPASAANTGIGISFPNRLSAVAEVNEVRPLSELVETVGEQPLSAIEQIGNPRYRLLRLGDWSLFPLFQPGDILLIEPRPHKAGEITASLQPPRPIVLVSHGNRYALGHLVQAGPRGAMSLEAHPESGYPSLQLKDNDWSLVGIVRGYCASLVHRAGRIQSWRAPGVSHSRVRVPAKSRFAAMCRTARFRRGLSVEGVVEAIRELAPSLPGPASLFLLSKSRVGAIESGQHDSKLNIFGLFALMAVYGLDYRDAMDALGCPIDDTGAIPIQQTALPRTYSDLSQIANHKWFRSVLEMWGSIPWQIFPLYPNWSKDRILYHGPKVAHPMIQARCFFRLGKWRDLPNQPLRAGHQMLSWPLFAFQTREGIVCMNAYRCGRQVRFVQHSQRAQSLTAFDLGRDADLIGRVTDVATMLPASFGWD
jgi:hypothetical protein